MERLWKGPSHKMSDSGRAQTPSDLLEEVWTIEVTEAMGKLPRDSQLVGSGRGRPGDFGSCRLVASRRSRGRTPFLYLHPY